MKAKTVLFLSVNLCMCMVGWVEGDLHSSLPRFTNGKIIQSNGTWAVWALNVRMPINAWSCFLFWRKILKKFRQKININRSGIYWLRGHVTVLLCNLGIRILSRINTNKAGQIWLVAIDILLRLFHLYNDSDVGQVRLNNPKKLESCVILQYSQTKNTFIVILQWCYSYVFTQPEYNSYFNVIYSLFTWSKQKWLFRRAGFSPAKQSF